MEVTPGYSMRPGMGLGGRGWAKWFGMSGKKFIWAVIVNLSEGRY